MTCGSSNCACCKRRGCEGISLATFGDCRYDVLAGTAGGTTIGANAFALIRSSWSGVDPECEADSTQLIEATFTAADYGDQFILHLDVVSEAASHYAILTLNADPETQGTLKLYNSGAEIATLDVTALPGPHTLRLCYDQLTLTAVFDGSTRLEEDSDGNGGLLAAVGTAAVTSEISVSQVLVGYKLYDAGCADCFTAEADPSCEDPCLGGLIALAIKLRWRGAVDAGTPPLPEAGDSCNVGGLFDGTYILRKLFCGWVYRVDLGVTGATTCTLLPTGSNIFDLRTFEVEIDVDEVNDRHRLVLEVHETHGSNEAVATFVGPWQDGDFDLDCVNDLPFGDLTYVSTTGTNVLDYSGVVAELLAV